MPLLVELGVESELLASHSFGTILWAAAGAL